MVIAEHIARVCEIGGVGRAIDCNGEELSWAALQSASRVVSAKLQSAGLSEDTSVGLLGRNGLAQVAAFIAVLGSRRALVLLNALRPARSVAQEITELVPCCLIGSGEDLTEEILAAARGAGTLVLRIAVTDSELRFQEVAPRHGVTFHPRDPGVLIEIETSGTTGKPKRISVTERTVEKSLRDGVRTAAGAVESRELQPKTSPALMFAPLVHTSGTFNVLMSVFEARPIVLFERFDVAKFRAALVRHRPKFIPLPPTAIRMLLESEATPEEFSSVLAVRAGTAALPIELHAAFEEKFRVPVLTTYGATEFLGVATSWTLKDYRKLGRTKRGSVGRPSAGVELRVIDPATGEVLAAEQPGVLEVRLERLDDGRSWIRTTDLARIDEDGFLYILGRLDDAINRGGFKVMAGKIADTLRSFPDVYDVIVVGRPDPRLGEVPVAVVEPRPGTTSVTSEAVKAHARRELTAYEVPARVHIVPKLPRTVSDKVSRPEIMRLIDQIEGARSS